MYEAAIKIQKGSNTEGAGRLEPGEGMEAQALPPYLPDASLPSGCSFAPFEISFVINLQYLLVNHLPEFCELF